MKIFLNSKYFIVLICIFICFPSHSKWKKFKENSTSSEYFEVDAIKKVKGIIFAWSMIDYKKPLEDGNLSTKYYSKYDCGQKRFKVITIIKYKTRMGRGRDFEYIKNLDTESEESDWSYPLLGKEDYSKISFVCHF